MMLIHGSVTFKYSEIESFEYHYRFYYYPAECDGYGIIFPAWKKYNLTIKENLLCMEIRILYSKLILHISN
jgi:hypothetical protein